MKKLSKITSTLIALVLMLSTLLTFSACSSKSANDKTTSNEEKALSCIDEFMTALEKGDVKAYTKCLDPDIQTIIESGTNSLGNALGIDNAYGLSSSFSTLINSSILESTETKVHYIRKEIQSSAIEEDKASFYIVYTVTVESKLLEKPEQDDCTLEFKLVKKEGKWYIQSYNEISEKTDTEILAEGFNIKYGTNFSDGIAFIQYTDENGNYKAAAIDTSGKIIFEPDGKFNIERVTGYKNGIMVIDNLIYDKTGKIIASPEITGYDKLLTTNCNGYVLAMKTEESFEGDRYYIGLLNNKGKWEQELSTEHPIIQAFEQEGDHIATLSISEDYDYISDTILRIDVSGFGTKNYYYNIAENKISKGYVHLETQNRYDKGGYGVYKYDLSGDLTLLLKDVDAETLFENSFIGRTMVSDDANIYKLYDFNGNVITDLSDYKFASHWSNNGAGIYYVNEHLLIPMDNGSGSKYLCLINKSGKTAFEPIKMGSEDDFYALDENGFVYESVDENNYSNVKYKLYDYSGNITEYEDVVAFHGFHDGLALVKNTADQYYYINVKGEKVIK